MWSKRANKIFSKFSIKLQYFVFVSILHFIIIVAGDGEIFPRPEFEVSPYILQHFKLNPKFSHLGRT